MTPTQEATRLFRESEERNQKAFASSKLAQPPSNAGQEQEIRERVQLFCENHGLREYFIQDDLFRMVNASLAAERDEHCKDCCCARSWEALGDSVKGVGSIPEHIEALRQQLDSAVEALEKIKASNWLMPSLTAKAALAKIKEGK